MAAPILQLAGIRKTFGGVQALSDGTLALYPGEATALMGENGAGKSTLVKIMTGIHQPDAGRISIAGAQVRIAGQAAARRLGISAIHQEAVIFDDLSVTENIFIADPIGRAGFLDWTAMRRRARTLLESIDAKLDPDAPAGHLSVAQKHQVQIARALAQKARILVMDEPSAALSQREVGELFAVIRRLKAEGCAILFISHRFDEVFEICERYAVFRDGAAVGSGRMADIDRDRMIALMVGRPAAEVYPKKNAELGGEALRVQGFSRGMEFEDVEFSVRKGEILGLYGLIGAGRSELMQSLFGLAPPDGGSLWIGGRKKRLRGAADAISAGIAYVPEDRQMQGAILPLSIRDNIALASWPRWSRFGLVNPTKRDAQVRAMICQLQIKAGDPAQALETLSGGNQQKVVLAKWLSSVPQILILDEPTKGIDIGAKAGFHAIIGDLAAKGMAVILVSSDLPEIMSLSDRVLAMRHGRIQGAFLRGAYSPEMILRAAAGA